MLEVADNAAMHYNEVYQDNEGDNMRLPTKNEVMLYLEVVNKVKPPKTELGKLRLVAKYFHCTVKDIEAILA